MKKLSIHCLTLVLIFALFSCGESKHAQKEISSLDGSWQLVYIKNDKSTDELFTARKPTMILNTTAELISGNAGCNSYSGTMKVSKKTIDLTAPMAATKMMCATNMEGEQVYLTTMPKVNAYIVIDNDLMLMEDAKTLMKFERIR